MQNYCEDNTSMQIIQWNPNVCKTFVNSSWVFDKNYFDKVFCWEINLLRSGKDFLKPVWHN